ncbi:MAG: class I SAM-dependent methyltransferase [Planctomycetes bacterium]|nr:class I SAM-dependent methyltransferase [Planctomycetota bacterium]MCH8211500.1 class I SAM-dependent methyltransferase [Planctomycetota bacterium]
MEEYLKRNSECWQAGYDAENVESFVFRPYGRIFKTEFGLTGSNHERLLDFGCGQGAALRFFRSKGFDVYGVDISETDIARCQETMSDIPDHFAVIAAAPSEEDVFFGGEYDLIIAVQALYYYSDSDLQRRLVSLHNQMKPGAILYATMMGPGHYKYEHSQPYKDGLRKVEFSLPRLQASDHYVNFTHSEDELIDRFSMFEKVHVGFYDAKYREDEGASFHYTFVGRAKK